MRSRLIEVGFQVIDMFSDQIPGALDSFQDSLDSIDPSKIVSDLRDMWSVIEKNKRMIEGIGIAILAYNVIIKAVTVAQWAFNAAIFANPLGLLIASIVTLTTVTTVWAKNWDSMTAAVKRDLQDINWAIEDFVRDHPIISSMLGLSAIQPRSKAEIQRERDRRDEAEIKKQVNEPGYLLGTKTKLPTTEKGLQRVITRRLDMLSSVKLKVSEKALPNILLGSTPKVSAESAATQKVQISGEFNFKNPPQGMTFKQSTKGAPPIQHNLGKNQ